MPSTLTKHPPKTSRLTASERAARYLEKVPPAVSGQGGHDDTFRAALSLVQGFGLSEQEALPLLQQWNRDCKPPWSPGELQHKLRSAAAAHASRPRGYLLGDPSAAVTPGSPAPHPSPPAPRRPAFEPMVARRVASTTQAIPNIEAFVTARSPLNVAGLSSLAVLSHLYPPGSGERVLVFSRLQSQGQLLWEADCAGGLRPHVLPEGPDGVWFLPQPVDGLYHSNPRLGGKPSRRSEESVTAWRYLVLESDEADRDHWLRCLIQMPLPIASICDSGGRSIHALVRVDAPSKEAWDDQVRRMKPTLVTLGADPAALTAIRLTRLPQAMRGQKRQRLMYLDPTPTPRPIFSPGCLKEGAA